MESDKPALTFSEALQHYFAMANALYEAKARGDYSEMTAALKGAVDSLRTEMTKSADSQGLGKVFRSAVHTERAVERRTLWLRTITTKLKAARPGLLSLELLGSAAVVVMVAYYIVHTSASLALLLGLALVGLRLILPSVMDKLATDGERKLRKLRRVDNPDPS